MRSLSRFGNGHRRGRCKPARLDRNGRRNGPLRSAHRPGRSSKNCRVPVERSRRSDAKADGSVTLIPPLPARLMGDSRKNMTMSMRNSIRLIIVFSSLFAASAGLRAEGTFVKLKGAQIQTTFTGVEMTDGVHWADVFAAGGILTTYAMGRKTTGTWRVE